MSIPGMPIPFPPEIESFLEHEVASGSYGSREELIVAAIELLKQRQVDLARLKTEIAEGFEGEGIPGDEVFANLRAKYAHGQ